MFQTIGHSYRIPVLLLFVAAALPNLAPAADLPKRKSGLWEINMRMEGRPVMGAMQQCIDQNTDNLMQQEARKEKPDCSAIDVKPSGNTVSVHSVCKVQGSTATTDGVFVGSFDSSYKGDLETHYSPPLQGMKQSKLSMEARWVGPCKPGQKPGDVIMPNAGPVNVNEMLKDPKIQEMMKRQK